MKIDKSCYLVHDPIFDNTPTPLAYSQAIYTLSFLMADRLRMATGWWIHEAEEIVKRNQLEKEEQMSSDLFSEKKINWVNATCDGVQKNGEANNVVCECGHKMDQYSGWGELSKWKCTNCDGDAQFMRDKLHHPWMKNKDDKPKEVQTVPIEEFDKLLDLLLEQASLFERAVVAFEKLMNEIIELKLYVKDNSRD